MIYSVRGNLIHIEPAFVVIECAGVGYKCFTSMSTQRLLPKLNSEAMLYTQLIVREDSAELYGFASTSELSCFKLLTSVSKVGPKAAISILSELSPEQLAICIASSDSKAITRANGVGLKLAQRIILELKDKLKVFDTSGGDMPVASGGSAEASFGNTQKAVEALAVLGYDSGEVLPILSKLDSSKSVEDLISAVLREMAAR
ncbi:MULTISPECIES: Holliday junction branch migration protein RuvA [unclassified Ruminococcus]|uniref:Holliday junction branch migration protein RuvA n=1 Tax=unclassified Ruminococcus TaxID=2608920 RepID=UPI00210A193C|nr:MULTISPECIES: Holliday junction branch migration protein RuvA [unclassified Ruminococcus]MCQ4022145.1 Holliday junction branch migration protein RuvA [Ruminococcus sp. zg-924]MCQ4114465.1 Holliday junction branch migration protein RuvA [Ruminococcus sp. zg-921]